MDRTAVHRYSVSLRYRLQFGEESMPHGLIRNASFLAIMVLARDTAVAQGWTEFSPAEAPYVRYYTHAVFDPHTSRVIYIGGDNDASIYENSTWAYAPSTHNWVKLDTTGTTSQACPGDSVSHWGDGHPYRLWDFDPSRNRIWKYGGVCSGVPSYSTWYWTSGSPGGWTSANPIADPAHTENSRYEGAAVFLPMQDKLMLFGGLTPSTTNQVWLYDPVGNSWKLQVFSGVQPPRREGQCMVWDSFDRVVLVFSGQPDYSGPIDNQLWKYDPARQTWKNMNPSNSPLGSWFPQCAFDSKRHNLVYFYKQNVYAYDLSKNAWANLSIKGGPVPVAGESPAFAYDSSADTFIYITGRNATKATTWELKLPEIATTGTRNP